MSFLFFRKEKEGNALYYVNDYDNYKLAGYGLIYQTWKRRGKPVNMGWSVTAGELLRTYSEEYDCEDCNEDTYALVIDFHPSSKERIALIEIERIHIYTYATTLEVTWSPLMLELRDVYYEESAEEFTNDLKNENIKKIEVRPDRQKSIEFLYLNGDYYSWNWGRNGMTNAVFLHEDARNFFRQFF